MRGSDSHAPNNPGCEHPQDCALDQRSGSDGAIPTHDVTLSLRVMNFPVDHRSWFLRGIRVVHGSLSSLKAASSVPRDGHIGRDESAPLVSPPKRPPLHEAEVTARA